MLWLVEYCVISCNNHFARGDSSKGAKFQMTALRLEKVSEEVIDTIEENSIAKNTEDATEFGVTFLRSELWSFCWFIK